jgi:hypothetical protein
VASEIPGSNGYSTTMGSNDFFEATASVDRVFVQWRAGNRAGCAALTYISTFFQTTHAVVSCLRIRYV